MFDEFMGLPLHVLVLHAAVVLIPVAAVATVATVLRPDWRRRFAAVLAGGNLGLLALTFVTVRSGYALQDKLDPTNQNIPSNNHEEFAEALLWVILALALASIVIWAATRMEVLAPPAVTGLAVLVALLAVASLALAVVTGHTGSDSHWGYLFED